MERRDLLIEEQSQISYVLLVIREVEPRKSLKSHSCGVWLFKELWESTGIRSS